MVHYDPDTAWWVHECEQHRRRIVFTREANAKDCDRGHMHFGHGSKVNLHPSEWLERHWILSKAAKRH